MSDTKTLEQDRRGPNEPSYRPVGLRMIYWSDLGAEEEVEFKREREPSVEEVRDWLQERGYSVVPTGE